MPTGCSYTAENSAHRSRRVANAVVALIAAPVGWLIRHRLSRAVRCWRPGAGTRRVAGDLSVRTAGHGDRVVVLLHGLTASGDVFGDRYNELADDAQLVVPDLLGFGRSPHEHGRDYALQAQLAALDRMATDLKLDGRALTIAGHSLGALLALHWAASRNDVQRVGCFCAPLYIDAQEADERIAAIGGLQRVLAPQGPVSESVCGWMCRHRAVAQWIAVAVQPQWPTAISRMAVRTRGRPTPAR